MPKKEEEVIKRAEWEIFERKGKVAVKKKTTKNPEQYQHFSNFEKFDTT